MRPRRIADTITLYQGSTRSIRILVAIGPACSQRFAISASVGWGADAVRPLTGAPSATKKSSSPGGEQTQIIRAGFPDLLLKKWTAFEGTVIVDPATRA